MSASGERTEKATPRRRLDARRQGQVAKSADLSASAGLIIGGLTMATLAPAMAMRAFGFARSMWDVAPASTKDTLPMGNAAVDALSVLSMAAIPLVLVCASAGMLTAFSQIGPIFAPKAIRPNLKRLDPVSGAKKLFSMARLMVVVRAGVALLLTVAVAFFLSHGRALDILRMPLGGPGALAGLIHSLFPSLIAACGLVLLIPGAIDLLVVRRRLEKELRMTRQEVRDEHKRDEGDPTHKGRRRQAHRELAAGPSRPLKEAKALLVNPTHLAVALHHGPDLPVPQVGVRGRAESAARLRAEARALGIPIVRDVPLARALFTLDPGTEVPEPLFAAVAAVLAAIYRAELASTE